MELENKINADIKQAMLAKESRQLQALRAIKAALLLAKTSKDAAGGDISDEVGSRILQKLIKQRQESAEMYRTAGRNELADEEIFQVGIIEKYLPKMMNEEEIRANLEGIIVQVGASGIKDLGKVMGLATKQFAGKADNKLVVEILKQILQS